MKIQNLSIIFVVIMVPIIMMLSFYIERQTDTLELQEAYNTKMIISSKNAIKAFEINTVDWGSTNTSNFERRTVESMVNTFTESLAGELGIAGTAREYMLGYIPAIAVNMYDGYYIYAPTYTYKHAVNSYGRQLFAKNEEQTASETYRGENGSKVLYLAKNGVGMSYKNIDEAVPSNINATTNVAEAQTAYEHELGAKISYTSSYDNTNTHIQAVVNYTLDNRIYVYGLDNTNTAFKKDGYLVYFDYTDTVLPQIQITTPATGRVKESNIKVNSTVSKTIYAIKLSSGYTNKVLIEPENLTEQIVYRTETGYDLGKFPYIYDITHTKLYFDKEEDGGSFFTLNGEKEKVFLPKDATTNDCKWKSVSVLLSKNGEQGENITEYKKIYQALNGKAKGNWYINLNPDEEETDEKEIVDTKIENTSDWGISNIPIYQDCSDISYYVEAYAFTNWVRLNLGRGTTSQIKMQYDGDEYKSVSFDTTSDGVSISDIFNISQTNNPEDANSIFSLHKREIMKENITENLTLAISNYNEGTTYDFKVPLLTENDWDTMFENISILTFIQGMPIGLKYYNNYVIATSKMNDAYVDPNGIYLSGEGDTKYHLPYCKDVKNIEYTGYRGAEYVLRNFTKTFDDGSPTIDISYYMHDGLSDNNSELGCYNCIVNRGLYRSLENTGDEEIEQKISKQMKSYDEALARERYYQLQKIETKVGIIITYNANLNVEGVTVRNINPNTQEALPNVHFNLYSDIPVATANNGDIYKFSGWSLDKNATTGEYSPGSVAIFPSNEILYAIWKKQEPQPPPQYPDSGDMVTLTYISDPEKYANYPHDFTLSDIKKYWREYGCELKSVSNAVVSIRVPRNTTVNARSRSRSFE